MPVAIGLRAPASESDKLHAAVTAEVETLRLRVRALTATNTNLRKRLKHLESQHAPKAMSLDVTPLRIRA